jgi:hypothetical protein
VIHAGARALAHLRREGLSPRDIVCVPAAAGGPKGLVLIPLDQRLFGSWLAGVPHVDLVGASIGAWRMFAAAQADPVTALQRLCDAYVAQRYPPDFTPQYVSAECRKLAKAALGGPELPPLRPGVGVSVVTARARGALAESSSRFAFTRAALANVPARGALARHLERVVFHAGDARFPARAFDAFGVQQVSLTPANAEEALLASGSIPLLCDPVVDPAGAPPGRYWDGGLIDYHFVWPYRDLKGLVLYPHFAPRLTAGWLDKYVPWRRHARTSEWLENLLLVSPSAELVSRLPHGKLPDRQDFYRHGPDHDARMRDWRRAIAECERFADETLAWLERPDPARVRPLGRPS